MITCVHIVLICTTSSSSKGLTRRSHKVTSYCSIPYLYLSKPIASVYFCLSLFGIIISIDFKLDLHEESTQKNETLYYTD